MDVDLDDARIRRDAERVESRIARRLIALDDHRLRQRLGSGLHRRHQLQIILERVRGRHEYMQQSVAHLHAHGRPDHMRRGFPGQRRLARPWLQRWRPRRHAAPGTPAAQFRVARQRTRRLHGIGLMRVGIVFLRYPGQGLQRQAQSQRRIARHQVAAFRAQEPRAGLPAGATCRRCRQPANRQHVTDDFIEPLAEQSPQSFTLYLVVDS